VVWQPLSYGGRRACQVLTSAVRIYVQASINYSNLVHNGSGLTITPTSVSLPVPPGEDLEPYESMLVVFPQILTVSQKYFQGRYGQVTLSAGRMYNPTNGNGLGDTVEYNLRRMIVLDDASSTQNPNPIPYIGEDNTLRAGDEVSGVTGVVDYGLITSDSSIRFYRLQPTVVPVFSRVNERTKAPEEVGDSLKVASLNVFNFFNGDGQGGGFPADRGAVSFAEFVRQRTKIITATVSLNADIVGLMEIENDGDDSLSAIQDLVNGLNDATATGTYAFIVEPNPRPYIEEQIKVSLIYKPEVVTPVGATINYQVYDNLVYQPLYDRPPLVQLFSLNATGQTFYVIVNHFKSKSSCPVSPADPDADYGQGCWNAKRLAQAEGMLDLITELEAAKGEPDVLIIGDLNAYGEEDPILVLTDGGLVNELDAHVAAVDRYSYVFDGQSGYLDQALATASLDEQINSATIWHINANEPEVINYSLLYKPQDLYTPTPYRSSDHDPVLVGLDLRPSTLLVSHTILPNMDVDLGGVVTYTVTFTNQTDVTAMGIMVTDILPAEVTFMGWVVQSGATESGGEWSWDGDLAAGADITFVYTAPLDVNPYLYDSSVTNVVQFTSTNDGSGSSPAIFYVISPPVLDIDKVVAFANDPPEPGEWVTYTVVLSNVGPSTAWNVHVTDILPEGVFGEDVNITVTIPAEDSFEAVIPAILSPDNALYGTTITNTAVYECLGVGSGTASIAFDVASAPALVVEKTVELAHDPAQPGDPITYTITISNQGESDAIDVHIQDLLPLEVIGSGVDVTVTITAGSSYQIVIPVTLSPNVEFGTIVTNSVYVYHASGDVSTSAMFQVVAWIRVRLPLIYRAP
jgi:uncharacterized repeat protein (TIGR01451 family)